MSEQKTGFGPHLILDAYGCPAGPLNDVGLIYQFMKDLTSKIGMNALGPPVVYEVKEEDITYPEDTGITGMIVFAESHSSFHGFPKKGFFVADVFSCKSFDPDVVKEMFKETFQPQELVIRKIERGEKFPRSG